MKSNLSDLLRLLCPFGGRSLRFCAFALVLSAGCACPHRNSQSLHVIESFDGRSDGLISRETWRDTEKGGGQFLFTDPSVQTMVAMHTNQSALGGGSVFSAGAATITVDTNSAAVIGSAGTAIGNVIGAAAKSAAK
jgi:hypothetical protein